MHFLFYAAAADDEKDDADDGPALDLDIDSDPERTSALHLASIASATTGWSCGSMWPALRTVT